MPDRYASGAKTARATEAMGGKVAMMPAAAFHMKPQVSTICAAFEIG